MGDSTKVMVGLDAVRCTAIYRFFLARQDGITKVPGKRYIGDVELSPAGLWPEGQVRWRQYQTDEET